MEVMAPQDSGAGALDLSLRLKFSEIVPYKIMLALVDFVFTFLFIHTFM